MDLLVQARLAIESSIKQCSIVAWKKGWSTHMHWNAQGKRGQKARGGETAGQEEETVSKEGFLSWVRNYQSINQSIWDALIQLLLSIN